MQQLKTLHLHDPGLQKLCNGDTTVQLVGSNMQILVSGLVSMYGPEVKKYIRENNWQIGLDSANEEYLTEAAAGDELPSSEVHFYPGIEGSGRTGQIIAGIVLVVVGAVYGYYTGDWQTASQLMIAGVGMIIAAVSAPKAQQDRERPDERPSFIFNGAVNTLEQGGPVNLVYGRTRTGSTVVSAGIGVEQLTAYTSPMGGNPAPNNEFDVVIP